jgi:hypothetical protein
MRPCVLSRCVCGGRWLTRRPLLWDRIGHGRQKRWANDANSSMSVSRLHSIGLNQISANVRLLALPVQHTAHTHWLTVEWGIHRSDLASRLFPLSFCWHAFILCSGSKAGAGCGAVGKEVGEGGWVHGRRSDERHVLWSMEAACRSESCSKEEAERSLEPWKGTKIRSCIRPSHSSSSLDSSWSILIDFTLRYLNIFLFLSTLSLFE